MHAYHCTCGHCNTRADRRAAVVSQDLPRFACTEIVSAFFQRHSQTDFLVNDLMSFACLFLPGIIITGPLASCHETLDW